MPALAPSRVPSYCRHKPTNQAVVTINGRDIYLGKWNTAASKAEYDRLIAEFLANGRRLRNEIESTVVEVINAYRKFAERYYRKNGGSPANTVASRKPSRSSGSCTGGRMPTNSGRWH